MNLEDAITISRLRADLLARALDRGDLEAIERGAALLSCIAAQLRAITYQALHQGLEKSLLQRPTTTA